MHAFHDVVFALAPYIVAVDEIVPSGKACAEHRESRGVGTGLGERVSEVVAAFIISRSASDRQISLIVILHTQPI